MASHEQSKRGNDKKLVGVYLPPSLVLELKISTARQGKTMSAVVEEALREYLRLLEEFRDGQ